MRRGNATRYRLAVAGEIVAAVGLATGLVALLESTAPVADLQVLYVLAVLAVAIRRGQWPALTTAVLSGLTLNYLFIPPRRELLIAHSQDVVDLAVLVVTAAVVGRLAATARRRAAEAEGRARDATAREREAALLADVASAILAGSGVAAQLDMIGPRIARAIGASAARIVLQPVPQARSDELAVPLRTRSRVGWLYVLDSEWTPAELGRLSEPLARLIDVAVERARVAEQAAEAEAARRADVARTAILHAISHDLRSPLTAIATAGDGLRTAGISPEDQAELADVVQEQSARLARLVDDLLDLSRIEAGAVAPQTDWCDLRDVVAAALGHLGAAHPIELGLPDDLPLVRADAAQLERVFANLIDNAVKFSPSGSAVRISAGATSSLVTVRVLDHGPGISPSDRARLFEPFFRGRTRRTSGSGLGLAICRGFVTANGGQIVVSSDRHRGTSFAVTFPVAEPPPLGAAPAPRASAQAMSSG